MKKLGIVIIVFAFLAACKKEKECQHCTKSGEPEKELCEDQYNNHDEFHDAVEALKADGYDCHED